MTRIMHRNLRITPPVAVSARGIEITDSAGNRYIDASGGAAVSSLGHAHPAVLDAIRNRDAEGARTASRARRHQTEDWWSQRDQQRTDGPIITFNGTAIDPDSIVASRPRPARDAKAANADRQGSM